MTNHTPTLSSRDLENELLALLAIPSPAGFTDNIVHHVCHRLEALHVEYELTRRGAVRASLPAGKADCPYRALSAHLDTLGAQVRCLKDNGRLGLKAIGHWSARFAEGARATVFTDDTSFRGTILPALASGHIFNEEIDRQATGWDHLELRVDLPLASRRELLDAGFRVGDIVAIDPQPEVLESGYFVARHLDDKAGVAALLCALAGLQRAGQALDVGCHFLFSISEEVGSGASALVQDQVAELVAIDNGTLGPGQNTSEFGVTIGMADQAGPFDYHLTHHLLDLCRQYDIRHERDVFRYYRCDAASALEAGNDVRTALVAFGLDASHGYERLHLDSLLAMTTLLCRYATSPLCVARDRRPRGGLSGFPEVFHGDAGYDRDLLHHGR